MQDLSHETYENLSLKVIAVRQFTDDLAGVGCDGCTVKDELNCSMNNEDDESVYYHDVLDIDINTCPLNCIFKGHYRFLDEYLYYDLTNAPMPKYEDCRADFWRLYRKFSSYRNALEVARIKRK